VVTCRVCGTENEPGALYCGSCGSALVVDTAQTPSRGAAGLSEDVVVPRKQGRERTPGTEQGPDAARGAYTSPVHVAPVTPPDGEPMLVCAACGTANETSRVYCRRCAKELRPPVAAAPVVPLAPRRLGISPGFIAVAALAVVVLVVGAILLGGFLGPGTSVGASASPTATPVTAPTAAPTSGAPTDSPEPTASALVEGDVPQGQIVYAGGASNVDLFLINADGSGSPDRLTRDAGPDRDAAFSPDGTRIVYASANGIRILTIASGDIEVVTSFKSDTNPFWSPVDDTLLFAGKRGNDPELEILRYVLGEDTVTPLTDNQVQDHDPVWSPDGTRIAWVLGAGDQRELMTMDRDGENVERLTNDDENDVDPAFSPTGDRLVFASKRGDGDDFDLFLYDLATRNITQVTDMAGDEHDPAWSPGGRFLVFHHGPPGQEDLFILDLVENKVSPLTQAPQRQLLPAWH
jgi:Tol biopolymer transport system component